MLEADATFPLSTKPLARHYTDEIMLRVLRIVAVCTAGVAATAAAALSRASEETPPRRSGAQALVELLDNPTPAHGNFFEAKLVEPQHKWFGSYRGEVQQMQDPSLADTAARSSPGPDALVIQRTALQLHQPHCQRHQRRRTSTGRQRHSPRTLQQLSLGQEEHELTEHRRHQRFPKRQERVELNKQDHQAEQSLGKLPQLHKLMHDWELQKRTAHPEVRGMQQKEEDCKWYQQSEQQERHQQHFAHVRPQQLEEKKKVQPQQVQHRGHEQELGTTVRRLLVGETQVQQQQHPGFWRLQQQRNMQHQEHNHIFRTWQQLEESQKPQQQQELISPEKRHPKSLSVVEVPKEILDRAGAPRALQHIVQRQALDFGVPTEQQVHQQVRSQDERDTGVEQVQPVGSPPDSAPDVRGQEQKVMWGRKAPDVELPQQVNLSQVLIQNSPQLFFNYDQPQQRSSSKKKRENGSGGGGEYNWQQHVRGQPGRSDGEQQQREEDQQQEQLQQQQQQLLEEIFALGRDVDKGQQQLRAYQMLRQQLQVLHLLQLQLVQQLKLIHKRGKETVRQERQKMRQEDSKQPEQLQSVSLAPSKEPSQDTCAVENYPLFESFTQWTRIQNATARVLALNSDLLAAAHEAAEMPAGSFFSPPTPDLTEVQHSASSQYLGGSSGPDGGTSPLATGTSSLYQMRQIKIALKEFVPPPRIEELAKASPGRTAQERDKTEKKGHPQYQKKSNEDKQKPHNVERPPQPQQMAEHSSQQQLAQLLHQESDNERDVSGDKQQGGDESKPDKEHHIDAATHNSTKSVFSDSVRSPWLPSFQDSLEHSVAGPQVPSVSTEKLEFVASHFEQPSQIFTALPVEGEYTKQEERRQPENGKQADVQSGPRRQPCEAEESSHAKSTTSIRDSNAEELTQAPTSAADRKGHKKTNVATRGSVYDYKVPDRHQQERKHREEQQAPDAQVPSLSKMPPETATSQGTAFANSTEEGERETTMISHSSVTNVDAKVFPDPRQELRKKHSSGGSKSQQVGAPQVREIITDAGTNEDIVGKTTTTLSARPTNTGCTRLKVGDWRCATLPGCGEEKPPQEGRQDCSKVAVVAVRPAEESELLPEATARLGIAVKAAHEPDCDKGGRHSLRDQKSFSLAEQSTEFAGQPHPETTVPRRTQRLQQMKQQHQERLAILVDRVAQQQGELEQRKRALQQQKEELSKLFGSFDSKEWERQQQALVDGHAPLQENGGAGQFTKKEAEEKAKYPQQQLSGRPLTLRNRIAGGKRFGGRIKAYVAACENF